jgi:hypothetical protein
MEYERDTAKPEFLFGHHKVWEVWDRKSELVKELYHERLKEWGLQVRKNGFQESADTQEVKYAEVRKNDVHRDWSMQQLPFDVTIGNRGAKPNGKIL